MNGKRKTIFACDDCGQTYDSPEEFVPLEDCRALEQRLDPGSVVPWGECIQCGAFVYEEEEEG